MAPFVWGPEVDWAADMSGLLRWVAGPVLVASLALVVPPGLDASASPQLGPDMNRAADRGGVSVRPLAARGGEYVPLVPARVVDSRTGVGGWKGVLAAEKARSFQVTGVGGVPKTGVSAVVLTVAAYNPTKSSFFSVYPTGESRRPEIAQLTFSTYSVSNTVIAKIGAGGRVDVFNKAGSANVILDVQGYFTDNTSTSAGGTFVALSPRRLYDSRTGVGGPKKPLKAQEVRNITVTGTAGIPAAHVSAVAVNVTAVQPTAGTWVQTWPAGQTRPESATVTAPKGSTVAALAQVKVGVGAGNAGKISLRASGTGQLDVLLDVQGYYLDNTVTGRDLYVPISPRRIYAGTKALRAGATQSLAVAGAKDKSGTVVPRHGVSAAVLSVTAASPNSAGGYMSVWPQGSARSSASVLNYAGTGAVTATVVAKLGSGGRINIYTRLGSPKVRVDVQGYFQIKAPPIPAAPSIGSIDYPKDSWTPSKSTGSFTLTTTSTAVQRFLYSLDDPGLAKARSAPVSKGSASITIRPGDGWHDLYVRAVDFSNNISKPAIWPFGTTAGVTSPKPGGRTQRFFTLSAVTAGPKTGITWRYRRAATEAWAPIPTDHSTVGGKPVDSWPVPIPNAGDVTVKSPPIVWDVPKTVYGVDGTVQVQACFIAAGAALSCSPTAVTATLDTRDLSGGSAVSEVGPGQVSLLSGNMAISAADISIDSYGSDLSINRTFNSLDPHAGPAGMPQQLSTSQAEVETDTTGFTGTNANLAAMAPAHTGTKSLRVIPTGAGEEDETYASVGPGAGGLRLGLTPGRSYNFTTNVYVPAATGLVSPNARRGLRAVLFHRKGSTDPYSEVASNPATKTDTWQPLGLRATLPAGTTEAFLRLYNGNKASDTGKWVAFDHSSLTTEGIFGPGWVSSLPVDEANSDFTGLVQRGDTLTVTDADGAVITFSKTSEGTYVPTGDDATSGLRVTGSSTAGFVITDLDGNSSRFEPIPTGALGEAATAEVEAPTTTGQQVAPGPATASTQRLKQVVQPGRNQTTSVAYDAAGRVMAVQAPPPPGLTGCANWSAGCRALLFTYNSAGHLSSVTFRTTDVSGQELRVDVACYSYDDGSGGTGRLLQAWDPRTVSGATGIAHPVACDPTNPVLEEKYTYDAVGRIATVTPKGLAGWNLGYDSSSRLTVAGRTHNAPNGGGTEATSVVYDVPVAKDPGHPEYRPDLTTASVGTWGQNEAPATAAAVFSPGRSASTTDLRRADVTYLNADGRVINTASQGAYGWAVTTSEYDQWGNTIRTLSAANREAVLLPETSEVLTDLGEPDPAARALALSTIDVYSTDGMDLIDTYGPYHYVTLPDSTLDPARAHTHYDYDTGTETGHPAGTTLHLETRQTTAASTSADPVPTDEQDPRTTTTEYALSSADATGWTFRTPMRVINDPSGIKQTHVTRYDSDTGLVLESRMPSEPTGGGAGTTVNVYYTTGANPADSGCGNKPAWAGLTCLTKPGAQARTAGLPGLVSTRVATYDYLNRPVLAQDTVADAAGADHARLWTNTFDNNGYSSRIKTHSVSGGVGAAIPATTTSYDTNTGLVTQVARGTAKTTTGHDDFGRSTKYVEAAEVTGAGRNEATTTYDAAGRVSKVTDAKGSITRTYNENGEQRDLPTSLEVSGIAGKFAGSYDADGRLVTQAWPNGVTHDLTYDETGYLTDQRQVLDSTWLEETDTANIHGQTRALSAVGAADHAQDRDHTYDKVGRLVAVTDTTADGQCTTRSYGYDANTNRTSRISYGPAVDGACQTGTATTRSTYSYDTADRLTPTGAHATLTYDTFGRITRLPSVDASAGQSDPQLGYYANDLVRSVTQDGATISYSLDSGDRLKGYLNSKTGIAKTNHYSDQGDSPAWISETTDHSQWTRNVHDLSGNLAATLDHTGKAEWQITNAHTDIAATSATTSEPGNYYLADEYGTPMGTAPGRYGWLGGKQRSSETPGGFVLMGARLYAPNLGRFMQTDPIPGGSANTYEYCGADPINCTDLSGQAKKKRRNGGDRSLPESLSKSEKRAWVEKHLGLPYEKGEFNSAVKKIEYHDKVVEKTRNGPKRKGRQRKGGEGGKKGGKTKGGGGVIDGGQGGGGRGRGGGGGGGDRRKPGPLR